MHASNSQPFLHRFELTPAQSQRTISHSGLHGNKGGRNDEPNRRSKFGTVKTLKIFGSNDDRDTPKEHIKSNVSSSNTSQSQRLETIKLNALTPKQDGIAPQKNIKNSGVLKIRSSQTAYAKKIEKIRTTFLYSGNYMLKFPWEYNFNERKAKKENDIDFLKLGDRVFFSSESNGELQPISMDFLQREIKGEVKERNNTTKESSYNNDSIERKIQQHKLGEHRYDGMAQSISEKLRLTPRYSVDHKEATNGFSLCKSCKRKDRALQDAENRLCEKGELIKKMEDQIEYYKALNGSKTIKALLDEEISNVKGLLDKKEKATSRSMKEANKYKDVLDYLKYCNIGNEKQQSSFMDFTNHYLQLERDFAELKKENERLHSRFSPAKKNSTTHFDSRRLQKAGTTNEQTYYSTFHNDSKSFNLHKNPSEELDEFIVELNNFFERLEFCIFNIVKNSPKQSGEKAQWAEGSQKQGERRATIEGIKRNIAKEFSLLLQEIESISQLDT